MSLLKSIQGGKIARPQRIVIYAPEGLGKTTLASQFPSPLFFDFEGGTHHLDVRRIEPKTLAEAESALVEISKSDPGRMGFQTVVIDTIDRLQDQATDAICSENKQPSIEGFGYGKGYVILAERVTKLLALLDAVKNAGFHVVLLAHSEIKKFEQPDAAGAYDRYQLKLEKKTEPLIKEWADALFFGNWKTRVAEKGENKFKAIGGKERMIYCNRSAAFDAKNRYGLADEEPWSIETVARAFAVVGAPWGGPVAKSQPVEDDDDQIPGIEGNPEIDELQRVCGPHAEAVNNYLLAKEEIKPGQNFLAVSPSYRARILKRPAEFLKVTGAIAPAAA